MFWPLPGHTLISQYFGENKNPLYASLGIAAHNGIDIAVPNGTEVLSATEGRVRDIIEEIVGISGTRGRGISILTSVPDQGTYTETIYWHLQDFLVQTGDMVKAGQVVAHSDNTGQSSGPHLHFGVRFFDKNFAIINEQNGYKGYVDPMPFFKPMMINQDELAQLYLAVFGRLPDDAAQGYVGHELNFVLAEMMKSPEYQAYVEVLEAIQHRFKVKL